MKDLVTEVNRKSDRIMWIRLGLKDFSMNIFSVYAPRTGGTNEEKGQSWAALQEELEKVDESERRIIRGDMNGHVGSSNDAIGRINEGYIYGNGDEDGEKENNFQHTFKDRILKELSHDMVDVNTWWNDANSIILRTGKEILGESSGKVWENKEIGGLMKSTNEKKGDIQSCENYQGIKLMSHTLKLLERIMDSRLRQVVRIGRRQLGFMKGIGTVDGIFSLRQTMEKYQEKQRVQHMVFIDLEKAYERVPCQEVWRGLRERGVQEKYVRMIQECYKDVTTRVRSTVGMTELQSKGRLTPVIGT
ncbi:uncharacterized protein LOC119597491 [Penaeus monodon]|uniref:uncharacterized protein LOC119597491 n=1 Tax=Penaeus monodon TaxID=6687 RepID=UPI0018A7AF74|nr:uncharacterized protein LOC119597491 [Penaeus monodon]